ncbi:MAG: GUN4 domain-containing protein [Dolichospermum sp.]
MWRKFGDKVGWRKGGIQLYYSLLTFDKKAPEGHLPGGGAWAVRGVSLLSRRDL